MGTITVGRITDRAAKTLLDETGVQWSTTELIDYLNSGMNAIVNYKPDAYTKQEALSLANNSKQELPSDGILVLDVIRNLGVGGSTPGRAIRQIDRNHLDNFDPDWHTKTGTTVSSFTFDKRNSRVFYIYPRVTGTWNVEVLYSAHPPEVDAEADILPLSDYYENHLFYWIMAMCYSKNAIRGDVEKMNMYNQLFYNLLGVKNQGQIDFSPAPIDESKQTGTER